MPAYFMLNRASSCIGKKMKTTRECERVRWELGRKGKKELCLIFVKAGRSQEEALAHPLTAQMGMRPLGSQDLLKVTGHLGAEPGHYRPFYTWLGCLSSGSQGAAGLRGLTDHQLVLLAE